MISPKSKIKNVAETTSSKNLANVLVTSSNNVSPKKANNNTTAILIKLLATKIVASNFLGRSNKLDMVSIAADCSLIPLSISDFVSEKKATSAPEIKAEQASRTKSNTAPVINDVLVTNKVEIKTVGSGSKIKFN